MEKACVCLKGYQYLMGACTIIPSCPIYSHWNGVTCVCQSGYLMVQGNCQPVQPPVPTCPHNSWFNGVSCACSQGFYQIRPGFCGTCSSGSLWNGVRCSKKRKCDYGFVVSPFNKHECLPIGQLCGPNAKWNGATCCCLEGFNLIGKSCVKCPHGTSFDGKTCSPFTVTTPQCGSN